MRNLIRPTVTGALLGAVTLAAVPAAVAANTTTSLPAISTAPSGPSAHQSVPVGAITDVGDLTKVAYLGPELTGLLGR
ncbi:hypothetical protein ACIGXM_21630 [Kitasatospora sp. NPDC052896]|uniref:hypothetical protein n=1 Tax=Kitasatospora sp. NPDC052896 TaxID=3364061 RepID=UPI0037C76BBE